MDINDMKASWLEAVSIGEAGGFSRMFLPDILDALEEERKKTRVLRDCLIDIHRKAPDCRPWSADGLCEISQALCWPISLKPGVHDDSKATGPWPMNAAPTPASEKGGEGKP